MSNAGGQNPYDNISASPVHRLNARGHVALSSAKPPTTAKGMASNVMVYNGTTNLSLGSGQVGGLSDKDQVVARILDDNNWCHV